MTPLLPQNENRALRAKLVAYCTLHTWEITECLSQPLGKSSNSELSPKNHHPRKITESFAHCSKKVTHRAYDAPEIHPLSHASCQLQTSPLAKNHSPHVPNSVSKACPQASRANQRRTRKSGTIQNSKVSIHNLRAGPRPSQLTLDQDNTTVLQYIP